MSFTTDLNTFFSSSQWPKVSGAALPSGSDPRTFWQGSDAACVSSSLVDLAAGLDAVMTGTQTIMGAKTFSSAATFSAGLSASVITGTTTSGTTAQFQTITLAGNNISPMQPYDIPIFYAGNPGDGVLLTKVVLARAVTLPASLSGSVGAVSINPAATVTLTLKSGTTAFATASISTGGTFTFTLASQTTLAAGTVLSVVNQATHDAGLADVSLTIVGTRNP